MISRACGNPAFWCKLHENRAKIEKLHIFFRSVLLNASYHKKHANIINGDMNGF